MLPCSLYIEGWKLLLQLRGVEKLDGPAHAAGPSWSELILRWSDLQFRGGVQPTTTGLTAANCSSHISSKTMINACTRDTHFGLCSAICAALPPLPSSVELGPSTGIELQARRFASTCLSSLPEHANRAASSGSVRLGAARASPCQQTSDFLSPSLRRQQADLSTPCPVIT